MIRATSGGSRQLDFSPPPPPVFFSYRSRSTRLLLLLPRGETNSRARFASTIDE